MVPPSFLRVLFGKVSRPVSLSLITLGPNFIVDLSRAACSFLTRRLTGTDRPPRPPGPGHSRTAPCPLSACNCSGRSEECVFDRELFRSTGHGGRCLRCRDHTAGPHCERCQEGFYRWSPRTPCQPCDCHPAGSGPCRPAPAPHPGPVRALPSPPLHPPQARPPLPRAPPSPGSLHLQCDDLGACACKPTVTGWKCDRCLPGFHSLSEGGCR